MENTTIDPITIIDQAVTLREALISQLAEIADTTDDPVVAIRAINAQVRATDGEVQLLRDLGSLPTPLSLVGAQLDARQAALAAVAVLNRHGVSEAAKAELVAALGQASTFGVKRTR